MTTSNGTVGDLVEGLVESVNDRGIKVAGEWQNLSKFHPVDLPDRGARVRVDLDGKGFIKSLQVLDGAPASSRNVATGDRRETRLTVLAIAANHVGLMGQSREAVRSDHVLVLADKWLAWVEQADQEQEEEVF